MVVGIGFIAATKQTEPAKNGLKAISFQITNLSRVRDMHVLKYVYTSRKVGNLNELLEMHTPYGVYVVTRGFFTIHV